MKLDFDEFCHGITQALNGRGSETSARPEQPCFFTPPCYVSLLPAHLPGPKALRLAIISEDLPIRTLLQQRQPQRPLSHSWFTFVHRLSFNMTTHLYEKM